MLMILRNGLRSTLRSRGRSALFTLLIFFLTLTLALGAGMWGYCAQLLERFDESYVSIALVEYMGEEYPDAGAADEDARAAEDALDAAAITALPGVERWDGEDSAMISLSGYALGQGATGVPYGDYAVAVVSGLAPMYAEKYGSFSDPAMLPANCRVHNADTWEITLYREGLEPLAIPNYRGEVGGESYAHYLFDPEDSDQPVKEETVPAADLPASYSLTTPKGNTVWMGIPEEYDLFDSQLKEYTYYQDVGRYHGQVNVLEGYTGRAERVLYSRDGRESFMAIFQSDDPDFQPEYRQRYLIHGKFVEAASSNPYFAVMDFYEGCEEKPWLAVSGSEDPALEESTFARYARRYRIANNAAQITAAGSMEALEDFQQGNLYLQEGRFPETGERGVCVLSGITAQNLGVGIGDRVELEVLRSSAASRYELEETGDVRSLEIVGVTNPAAGYEGRVWVSDGEGGFGNPLFGYALGTAVLDNRQAVYAAAAMEALLPAGCRLTMYDQGYAAAAQPIETMRTTAMAVTVAAACGTLAVLLLFAFLFVGRQRETVQVLTSLGTPGGKIRLWLLSGAAVIAGAAALAGAGLGQAVLGRVITLAQEAARQLYAVDTRYSDGAIGVVREAEAVGTPAWPALMAGVCVFGVALALCLVFLRQARRENAPKKGRVSVRTPRGKTSVAGRGAPRFAMLSIRRGGRRTAAVPAAALALTLFVGVLAAGVQGWSQQIDSLYQDARIQGQACSTNGRQLTGLTIPLASVQTLWQSGMLEDISVSTGWHYWLWEEMPDFGDSGFGQESREKWIKRQPELTAVNRLEAAPEFCYSGAPETEWLEGWDESFLEGEEYYPFIDSFYFDSTGRWLDDAPWLTYPVAASSRFLEKHDMALGDEFSAAFQNGTIYVGTSPSSYETSFPVSLKVVGSFAPAGRADNLYVPLSFWCDFRWLTGEEGTAVGGRTTDYDYHTLEGRHAIYYSQAKFSTCRFTLRSAYELEDLRDYLAEQSFSQVGKLGKNRTTLLLRDQSFVETVGGLNRYISFSRILFPVLFLVVGLLGFVISWLMVNGRRMEFAVMRGLGATGGRVFASFFLEQAALCLAGCLTGTLILELARPGAGAWLAAAGFLACYLAGCALSVAAVGRTKLMVLLSERE